MKNEFGYLYLRRGRWHYRLQSHETGRIRISTGLTDRDAAVRFLRNLFIDSLRAWQSPRTITANQPAEYPFGDVTYVLHAPWQRLVKIGSTGDLRRRFGNIMGLSPDKELKLRYWINGRQHEKELHRLFSSFRKYGEWFDARVLPDVLSYMRRFPRVIEKPELSSIELAEAGRKLEHLFESTKGDQT